MTCPLNPIERKANYAFSVNTITPHSDFTKQPFTVHELDIKPFYCNYLWRLLLDNSLTSGIIRLTGEMSYSGDRYGCMDMVGNAYEWVADWAKLYPGNPKPLEHKGYHFVRGGCWDDGPFSVHCAYRGWYLPSSSGGVGPGDSDYIGFRVAH